MAPGMLTILVAWNIIAIPVAIWLLSKRNTRHSIRAYRRGF